MKRVLIIGSAGAGKSTLAQALGEIANLPVIHLDSIFWQPGWVETPKNEWKARVESLLAEESWVVDGNYGGTLDRRLEACDTVFFLDFPRLLCLYRVFKRSVVHFGRTRPDMNSGCREKLPDWEFLKWIWTYPDVRRPAIMQKLSEVEGSGGKVFTISTPRELRAVIDALKRAPNRKPSGNNCSAAAIHSAAPLSVIQRNNDDR